FYNESLLYIKINNHEDFVKEMKRNYDITTGGVTNEKMYNYFNENRLLQVTRRDKIYNNAKL
ncbi:MAG: hypothetical protein LBC82_06955, partial [Oscillospiraceae bacterium]|nr:hypothetical protein [Oscillospiraceae bacterium]